MVANWVSLTRNGCVKQLNEADEPQGSWQASRGLVNLCLGQTFRPATSDQACNPHWDGRSKTTSKRTGRKAEKGGSQMWVNAHTEAWKAATCTCKMLTMTCCQNTLSLFQMLSRLIYLSDKCTNNINSAYGCFRVVPLLPQDSVSKEPPAWVTAWVSSSSRYKLFFCTTKLVMQKYLYSVTQKNRKIILSKIFQTMFYQYHKEGKISIWIVCKSCKQLATWTCHSKFHRHLSTRHWLLKFQYLKESN